MKKLESILFRQNCRIGDPSHKLTLMIIITPEQCRAARALLDWSQGRLAHMAGVGIVTVRQLEAGTHTPRKATLDVIKRALQLGGVEFIDENGAGPGVRLRRRRGVWKAERFEDLV
jgi:transcriptional regulator with XRE-family HTH domain